MVRGQYSAILSSLGTFSPEMLITDIRTLRSGADVQPLARARRDGSKQQQRCNDPRWESLSRNLSRQPPTAWDQGPDRTGDCDRDTAMARASPSIRRPPPANKHSSDATKTSCPYRDADKPLLQHCDHSLSRMNRGTAFPLTTHHCEALHC